MEEVVQALASLEPEGHPQLSEKPHHRRLTTRPVLVGDPCWSRGTWGDGSTPEKATPSDFNMYKQSFVCGLQRLLLPGLLHVSEPPLRTPKSGGYLSRLVASSASYAPTCLSGSYPAGGLFTATRLLERKHHAGEGNTTTPSSTS